MNPYAPVWAGGLGGSPFHAEMESTVAAQHAVSGLAYYASAGALDPKAPILDVPLVARATGLGYWAAYGAQLPLAMKVSLIFGIVFDPAHRFDNWGLDEVWHHSPTYDESWAPGVY